MPTDGSLSFEDESQDIGDTLRLEFEKGSFDNPKICAFILVKGSKEGTVARAPNPPPALSACVRLLRLLLAVTLGVPRVRAAPRSQQCVYV